MTEKSYCYILSKYAFYECEDILMVSSSCDEITTYFIREFRKLKKGYGLVVKRYEFGKLYDGWSNQGKSIRWIEKDYDGKIKDLMVENG